MNTIAIQRYQLSYGNYVYVYVYNGPLNTYGGTVGYYIAEAAQA